MTVRNLVKKSVEKTTNNFLYKRNIRKLAKMEVELKLLPILFNKDQLCLDIGANRGLYIFHLLKFTKNIVAFEPLIQMQEVLQTNYFGRIKLECVALSDAPGLEEIRFPQGNHSWATIEKSNPLTLSSQSIRHEKVEVKTLDSYSFQKVGFIKIDVEGHEESVLRGGYRTLMLWHPSLIIEIEERHKIGSVPRIIHFLESLDYAGYFIENLRLRPIAEFDLSRDQRADNVGVSGKIGHYINNFIFLPISKTNNFCALADTLLASV